jgi:hypothetical protein
MELKRYGIKPVFHGGMVCTCLAYCNKSNQRFRCAVRTEINFEDLVGSHRWQQRKDQRKWSKQARSSAINPKSEWAPQNYTIKLDVGRQTEANQERLKIEPTSGDELTTATNQEDPQQSEEQRIAHAKRYTRLRFSAREATRKTCATQDLSDQNGPHPHASKVVDSLRQVDKRGIAQEIQWCRGRRDMLATEKKLLEFWML